MNCKQGDLAIQIRSSAGNEGRIVRCVRFIGHGRKRRPGGVMRDVPDLWEIDPPGRTWDGKWTNEVSDAWLRPIRPEPGTDETLLWAPVPTTELESLGD
jgi:hypothetical protein